MACRATNKVLIGLVGAGIQRSLSPALHEEEARHHGLRLHYQLIDLDADDAGTAVLPELMRAVRLIGFAGLNVTYPCKQSVIPLLDALSEEARAIGAVNTVVRQGDRLVGHNTDGSGWSWGFRRALPDADLSRVVLLGPRYGGEKTWLLENASVFVQPSALEGLPIALMEAMASGLPVVASAISGIPELVEDGVSGLLVPSGDAVELADTLEKLAKNPDLGCRLGQAARDKVFREFNLELNATRLAELFGCATPSDLRSTGAEAATGFAAEVSRACVRNSIPAVLDA
jgi:glycosyltransferase involved in cell wall biosynthesis